MALLVDRSAFRRLSIYPRGTTLAPGILQIKMRIVFIVHVTSKMLFALGLIFFEHSAADILLRTGISPDEQA